MRNKGKRIEKNASHLLRNLSLKEIFVLLRAFVPLWQNQLMAYNVNGVLFMLIHHFNFMYLSMQQLLLLLQFCLSPSAG